MPKKLAVQIYTVRDYLNDTAEAEETLRKIYKYGYRAIEMAGFVGNPNLDWNSLIADSGLECCSIHEQYPYLKNETVSVAKKLRGFNCGNVVIAAPMETNFRSQSDVMNLAKDLNSLGRIYSQEGIVLHYHNHSMEFSKMDHETCGYQYLVENTDPGLVKFQPDVYWFQLGGVNPAAWLRKLKGRMPSVHLKDYVVASSSVNDLDKVPYCTELGYGVLPLEEILFESSQSGSEIFIMEVHDNWIDNDPFKSMEICADYCKSHINERLE
jgi:sugar phosphate isomerase/epimerase